MPGQRGWEEDASSLASADKEDWSLTGNAEVVESWLPWPLKPAILNKIKEWLATAFITKPFRGTCKEKPF